MKALRFHKFGPPSVLAIEEVPRPKPHDGEALVQVQAASINPSDVKNVAGYFPATTLNKHETGAYIFDRSAKLNLSTMVVYACV